MSSLGADYLRARGVLEATFSAYGGELGDPRDTATVAERLNRGHGKVARDPKLAGGGGNPVVPNLWCQPRTGSLACQAAAEAWREQIRGAYRFKRNALDTA
jgi:hypothetical protein